MRLNIESIKSEGQLWKSKGFKLPEYDIEKIRSNTEKEPEWIHFGGGNIFRAYIACLADDLIGKGLMDSGIIAVDNFDSEPIDRIYTPFDNLILLVGLRSQGDRYLRVLGSVARAVAAVGDGYNYLKKVVSLESLKIISYTITEKAYSVKDADGNLLPVIKQDILEGPNGSLTSVIGKTAALLFERYKSVNAPLSMVSMDNCSNNGGKLKNGIMTIIKCWQESGFCDSGFEKYAEEKISFPCTMIDKITPRPDPLIADELSAIGIEQMSPIVTHRGTYIAPYVNAEMPQYLVVEDCFLNGRPPLEEAGVFFTDKSTVDKAEKMKVTTCLNPLHTTLAIFGCLLGYRKIADEMSDPDLKKLVYDLAFNEGLPVVPDPGIINPEEFLNEVLKERLPNANLPDTPQRIATDTSQKLPVRFGETVKAYVTKGEADKLNLIPLVIAGWLRYLTGLDDLGNPMQISPDPELESLQKIIRPDMFSRTALSEKDRKKVTALLKNNNIFGTDLCTAGLSEKIIRYFEKMLAEGGAVRSTLKEACY